MKKQLLTAAVAAAVALPMIAQAGVYGRTDGVIKNVDVDGGSDYWDVDIDKMRWGIVGSEDLGNGMKALYHYEWAMDNGDISTSTAPDNGNDGRERTRLAYVGLEGGWGKMTIGRNWWPSYGAVWNKTDTADSHGTSTADGQNNLSGNRSGNMVTYSTPNLSGFAGHAAIVMSNESGTNGGEQEDGVDMWEITGEYKNGPLAIGATFRNDQRGTAASNNDVDKWGIGASYSFGDLTVEGNYGNKDPGGAAAETDVWGIGATYKMGDTEIHGAYRNNEVDNNGPEEDDWYVGVRHFLSKETRIFAEYRNTEVDTATTDTETDTFAVGVRKDWKL